jgi:hypothetical protein
VIALARESPLVACIMLLIVLIGTVAIAVKVAIDRPPAPVPVVVNDMDIQIAIIEGPQETALFISEVNDGAMGRD